jgi:hypothetical protein
MNDQHTQRDTMTIKKATVSTMWEIVAIVETLGRISAQSATARTSSQCFVVRTPMQVSLRPNVLHAQPTAPYPQFDIANTSAHLRGSLTPG